MPWRVSKNYVDCGVFVMRHMETYKGIGIKDFDAGFDKNEKKQITELNDLRAKYIVKILTSNLNDEEIKDYVTNESTKFNKLAVRRKNEIMKKSIKKIKERVANYICKF